jgi:hypothetical protein
MEMVKLLVSFLRLVGQRARRMQRWAPERGASLADAKACDLPPAQPLATTELRWEGEKPFTPTAMPIFATKNPVCCVFAAA